MGDYSLSGGVYSGEWDRGFPHGRGKLVTPTAKYDGMCIDQVLLHLCRVPSFHNPC
jgi:hypothetical protein